MRNYKGYEATEVRNEKSLLRCPHCYKFQEDSVVDHCVIGRPDNSKTTCIHCYKPFGVITDNGTFYVITLLHIKDNIC